MRPNDHLNDPAKDLDFNNPLRWADVGIWNPPRDINAAKYQKRIDKIVGLSDTGAPIVRLKWAWECKDWVNCEWDSFGNATKGEWRQRYRFLTVKIGEDYQDLSIPRWILEERFEPSQYEASWEQSRWTLDPETNIKIDIAGELPREGYYKLLWTGGMICTHDANRTCCERVKQLNRTHCWGYYKTPGEKELKMLARAVKERDENPAVDPYGPLPPAVLKAMQLSAIEHVQVEAKATRDRQFDIFRSITPPSMVNGKQFFDVPSGYQRKEQSGLYLPE